MEFENNLSPGLDTDPKTVSQENEDTFLFTSGVSGMSSVFCETSDGSGKFGVHTERMLFLDGATGTVLQQKGMKPGGKPEHLNLEDPDLIASVAQAYADAGSQIVFANTFGASPLKLAQSPYSLEEIIAAAIQNARTGCQGRAFVALDIGPLGELMEPMGSLTFEKAYDCFKQIVLAGVKAGADLIFFETMSDLLEIKAGILAAKENSSLPVFATMSFEENGRTFTGCTVESMGMTLTGLGVDTLGMNCSVGPDKLAPLIERLAKVTNLPIIAKPNAGMPDPIDGHYDVNPDLFLEAMKKCVHAGASILGGCCGTNPDYIRKVTDYFGAQDQKTPVPPASIWEILPQRRNNPLDSMVCSALDPVLITSVTPIGERINPTGKKRMQKALLEKDLDYLVRLAIEQQEAGAKILDVNVGYPGVDEEEMLPQVVKKIQSAVDLPLQLDSSNPKAIEAALRIYNGKPSVNSINAKQETMDTLLPVIKKYGAAVVGLTIDEEGIPHTAKKRIELAERMLENARKHGIPASDLWIDPLCLTVSAQQEQARETLLAIRTITETMHLQTVLGISNISFGLPWRKLIAQTFLIQAMEEGLRLPILNPNQMDMMDAIAAFEVLDGLDAGSTRYIERFANRPEKPAGSMSNLRTDINQTSASVLDRSASGTLNGSDFNTQSRTDSNTQNNSASGAAGLTALQNAVSKGLGHEAASLAKDVLQTGKAPLDIVEEELIPALDFVGNAYEKGTMFLPQLLQAANAAQAVFEVLKDHMAATGEQSISKGTIVLATVQGDVHDIGKNIVKTVLENYGFTVIDLGKDVAPEVIVSTVVEQNIPLVGLSALMTTTLPAMEETVRLLKQLDNPPKIMVGGAVVTQAYADEIGADFYGKDASASAAYAKEVFGV